MTDDVGLFDDADVLELTEPLSIGTGAASTPETQARWQEIKRHKLGETWEEGDRLFRRGPGGVTCFNASGW